MAFTLKSLSRALDDMAKLQEKLPAAAIVALAEAGQKILVATSAKSGGIKPGEHSFYLRRPTKRNGYASVSLVGRGFAILDEYGSYKKPQGYEIDPGGYVGLGSNGKANKLVLAGKPSGNWSGFAAYVHHPAQKAHPYLAEATVAIGKLADSAYDRAQSAALKRVGL